MRASIVLMSMLVGVAALPGCRRAEALESFTLEDRDKLIVEAPGCNADCMVVTPTRRICTLKQEDCHAVCQALPECRMDGLRVMKVCAVIRTTPR